ncbi:hypothetical protein GCM10027176_85000 [Actinoallomurus bryophytorum]|uniref:Uncharacterized protein n=1 Tax=Actinoallomurus bryophytorum TaxID=1490222 RepID=A0A543CT14_9ACTN|nr:hypothetical protein [Actinoallomurus bryophytorum]TQM00247.1 hypothetical protein FB559_5955 [Actinoallomurus bryophytorum]
MTLAAKGSRQITVDGVAFRLTMPYACPDNGMPAAAVLPGTVASAIIQALADCRRPPAPRPPFALTPDEWAVPAIRYRDEPRPIRRRRRRAGWCRPGGRRLRQHDLTVVNHLRRYRHRR